jgi:integrase
MRPGELCILRPGDVDCSVEVWEFKPRRHKTENYEKDRVVYLGPQAQEVLRPFLLRPADVYCFSPAEAVEEMRRERTAARTTPPSCGNRPGSNRVRHKPRRTAGDRYTPQSYNYAVCRACDKAFPVPGEIADDPQAIKEWRASHRWHPNQLRHALASKVRREYGLDAARTLLGHSSITVTQAYAEADRTQAIAVTRRIG